MTREDRIARNEVLFREVNERVRQVAAPGLDGRTDFLCECGDADCTESIALTLREYEELRSNATLFAIVPGHVAPSVEDVIAAGEGFEVVRKEPGEREIARKTDPRSDDG